MPRQIDNKKIKGLGDYLDRVYKLIPVEITMGYLAVQSYLGVPENPAKNVPYLVGFGIFSTVLVPLYLIYLQGVSNRIQIAVSTLSFPIWAVNISSLYVGMMLPPIWGKLAGIVLIGWVLVAPVATGKKL